MINFFISTKKKKISVNLQSCLDPKESVFKRSILFKCKNENPIILNKSNKIDDASEYLAREIHEENLEKLKEMSQDDILMEKKNLEATLDPAMLSFIKSMKESKKQLSC